MSVPVVINVTVSTAAVGGVSLPLKGDRPVGDGTGSTVVEHAGADGTVKLADSTQTTGYKDVAVSEASLGALGGLAADAIALDALADDQATLDAVATSYAAGDRLVLGTTKTLLEVGVSGQAPLTTILAPPHGTAFAAVAAAYENGGSGTFGADCTDWLLENLAMDTKGGGCLTVRGFSASNAANTVSFLINGVGTGLNGSWQYSNMIGGAPFDGNSAAPSADLNGAQGLDLCQFTAVLSIEHPHSSLQRRRFSFAIEYANNPTSRTWYAKWGKLFLDGGTEIVSLGLHSTVANGLAAESVYTYTSYGR